MIFLVTFLPDSKLMLILSPFNLLLALLNLRFEGFGLKLIILLIYLLIHEQQPLWVILGNKFEQIYPIQLEWLQTLHGLTRVELQQKMTDWYDRHRWSSSSSDHVFNTWSIHQLMNTGEFKPYWADRETPSRLINSKLLLKSLVSSV